jgi:riboflavin transporter FmnP
MTTARKTKLFSTANLTRMAILTAIALVLFFLEIPIIPPMYKLDFSNIPVLLGGFAMGPVAGLIILLMKNVLEMIIKGLGSTMGIGNLADFLTGAAYLLPATLIYRQRKTKQRAMVGMGVGAVSQTVLAIFFNWLVMIPFYMSAYHMDIAKIVGYATKVLPFVDTELKFYLLACGPFNLLKGLVISVVTALIYKPLSPLLKGRR